MIAPPAIGSIYWWPVPIALWFWHFSWTRRLSDRLTSKTRKHPDASLEGRSKRALWFGVGLTVFLLSHLLVIDWERPIVAVIAWAGGYRAGISGIMRTYCFAPERRA